MEELVKEDKDGEMVEQESGDPNDDDEESGVLSMNQSSLLDENDEMEVEVEAPNELEVEKHPESQVGMKDDEMVGQDSHVHGDVVEEKVAPSKKRSRLTAEIEATDVTLQGASVDSTISEHEKPAPKKRGRPKKTK